MAPIQNVALCSPTGKLGPTLLRSLEAEGLSITVVLRKSSKATFSASQKVIQVSNEYAESELVAAFKTVDAVVLSLPFELLSQAKKFAQASIAAGNRWLVASTYGANLEDPRAHLFPASLPHRQTVEELRELQKGQENWAWTAITCGPWPEICIAATAWLIDPVNKTAELIDDGRNVFTSTTREQLGLAVARLLKKQPVSMRNTNIHISSFEVDMLTWLNGHKQVLGSEGWNVTSVETGKMIEISQNHLAAGEFIPGYTKASLAVITGSGFQSHFSKFATLANAELDLPEEDLDDVVRHGLTLPNPFGGN